MDNVTRDLKTICLLTGNNMVFLMHKIENYERKYSIMTVK